MAGRDQQDAAPHRVAAPVPLGQVALLMAPGAPPVSGRDPVGSWHLCSPWLGDLMCRGFSVNQGAPSRGGPGEAVRVAFVEPNSFALQAQDVKWVSRLGDPQQGPDKERVGDG